MIRRAPRRERFTIVRNELLEDPDLSWKATALLVYILSKPDHWTVHREHLAKAKRDGVAAVRSALKELEDHGYITRTRHKRPDGSWEWDQVVHEVPVPSDQRTQNGRQVDENPGRTIGRKSTGGETAGGKPADIASTDAVSTDGGLSTSAACAAGVSGHSDDVIAQVGRLWAWVCAQRPEMSDEATHRVVDVAVGELTLWVAPDEVDVDELPHALAALNSRLYNPDAVSRPENIGAFVKGAARFVLEHNIRCGFWEGAKGETFGDDYEEYMS